MAIKEQINHIKSTLPSRVELVAISKFQSIESIEEAYRAGVRIFGESRPQELQAKYKVLPRDIEWHFIGHLQTNKIALIAPYVALIHSVDSERLLVELSKEALKIGRTLKVLLQLHIASEDTKQGFTEQEAEQILARRPIHGIEIEGVMGMATYTDNEAQVEREFRGLKAFFDRHSDLKTLSMGMSGDYRIAINCGSTMVRIGSSIFGTRNY